jgi:hypothetical protein
MFENNFRENAPEAPADGKAAGPHTCYSKQNQY